MKMIMNHVMRTKGSEPIRHRVGLWKDKETQTLTITER